MDEEDKMIMLARYYNWDENAMHQWFDESEEKLYELGIEFDERLRTKNL